MVLCGCLLWLGAPAPRCLMGALLLLLLGCWRLVEAAPAASPPEASCWDSELSDDLGHMRESLKSCHEDCNHPSITETKCRCLTFSKSYEGNCSAEYFIEGLSKLTFEDLADRIHAVNQTSCLSRQHYRVFRCDDHVSPRSFLNTLTDLAHLLASQSRS